MLQVCSCYFGVNCSSKISITFVFVVICSGRMVTLTQNNMKTAIYFKKTKRLEVYTVMTSAAKRLEKSRSTLQKWSKETTKDKGEYIVFFDVELFKASQLANNSF